MSTERERVVYDFAAERALREQRNRNRALAHGSSRHPQALHAAEPVAEPQRELQLKSFKLSMWLVSAVGVTMSLFFLVSTAAILVVLGHHYGFIGFAAGLVSIVGFIFVTVKSGLT